MLRGEGFSGSIRMRLCRSAIGRASLSNRYSIKLTLRPALATTDAKLG